MFGVSPVTAAANPHPVLYTGERDSTAVLMHHGEVRPPIQACPSGESPRGSGGPEPAV